MNRNKRMNNCTTLVIDYRRISDNEHFSFSFYFILDHFSVSFSILFEHFIAYEKIFDGFITPLSLLFAFASCLFLSSLIFFFFRSMRRDFREKKCKHQKFSTLKLEFNDRLIMKYIEEQNERMAKTNDD